MQENFIRRISTARALGMTSGILVILNLLSQEMVLPKSLFDIATSARSDVICLRYLPLRRDIKGKQTSRRRSV